jgi:Fic family protein
MPERLYEDSHGFLTFQLPPHLYTRWRLWQWLGEAKSKCEHIAGAALPPGIASELGAVYMAKGVHATTAIEGNTLSEEEVRAIVDGESTQPPSREYLEVEIRNVVRALGEIDRAVQEGEQLPLSVDRLRHLNRLVLEGTEHEPNAIPGMLREHSVGVRNYRAVPAEDVEYLLERLLAWVKEIINASDADPDLRFAQAVLGAITAHAYFAWIHPFGDGNGRTGRLLEAQILAQCGHVPLPAINLLSDHYNRTRDRYFRLFNEARERCDLTPFFEYAVEGYVDLLREQVDTIRGHQLRVAWINYVHQVMADEPDGPTRSRRRDLVLALTGEGVVPRAKLKVLTPELAQKYAVKEDKTLSRDLNRLVALRLIARLGRHGYLANSRVMEAFLPPMAH